jgi:uncharacterized protein YcbX
VTQPQVPIDAVAEIQRIHRYPVKSMLGEQVDVTAVDAAGLIGDRIYAIADADDGTIASAKLPRKWGRLLTFRAELLAEPSPLEPLPPVRITFPDGASRRSDDPRIDAELSAALGASVRLVSGVQEHAMRYVTTTEDGAVTETEKTGHIGRLGPEDRFFDLSPLHVITSATLERLRELEPGTDFDVRRYRPNLVLDTPGDGFVENDWVGKALCIGRVRITVLKLTARCVMPTLAQLGLPLDRRNLQAIAQHNRRVVPPGGALPCAGVYAAVDGDGLLRVGSRLQVLDA